MVTCAQAAECMQKGAQPCLSDDSLSHLATCCHVQLCSPTSRQEPAWLAVRLDTGAKSITSALNAAWSPIPHCPASYLTILMGTPDQAGRPPMRSRRHTTRHSIGQTMYMGVRVYVPTATLSSLTKLPSNAPHLRVHVGAVHVHLSPIVVDDLADLIHTLLVHSVGGGVRDHESTQAAAQRGQA